jgi:hypothetical protein
MLLLGVILDALRLDRIAPKSHSDLHPGHSHLYEKSKRLGQDGK